MLLCRLIAPGWAITDQKVIEGLLTEEQVFNFNRNQHYNVYYFPNNPSSYTEEMSPISGSDIDTFSYVFVDMDLKDGVYTDKDAFLAKIAESGILPTTVVDSGNGIHVYWSVTDLDAKSYLRFQRRLLRFFRTDEAVAKLLQLMRLPGTLNTKKQDNLIPCEILFKDDTSYTSEQLDKLLPPISREDEEYCINHYNKTYNINQENYKITDTMPAKWGKLLHENAEVKKIWGTPSDDRSKSDFRLAHIMHANEFTKQEAMSVLANSAKASQRAPVHRINYASNIVDKIWTYEAAEDKKTVKLAPTVRDILAKGDEALSGTRFPCSKLIDDTEHGFRLGQVIGIIGGSGVGKTTLTLNTFLWFAQYNPDYHHVFFSLEQPSGEIAQRIKTICNGNESLYDKIHIVSNYNDDGTYNHFSMKLIEEYIAQLEAQSGHKIGAVVIDHIGVLDKQNKNGENEGLIGVCREMKAVAVKLNIMLLMLSQAPREKAGIGDLELDKNAAYGTVFFESFVDYCICLWQPLKRMYAQGAPTVIALKFAKIRHKKQHLDRIKEDVCYQFYFDPSTERLREMTQDEETSAKYWVNQATNARKADKKTDIVTYESRRTEVKIDDSKSNHH